MYILYSYIYSYLYTNYKAGVVSKCNESSQSMHEEPQKESVLVEKSHSRFIKRFTVCT